MVCYFHEDSATITKRKLSHSALPLYFLRIECHGTFMEAPKHEKEKKKKTVQPPGVPGSSAERSGGEMSRWQRPGLTLCWFLPPIRQWNLILGADLQKQKIRRALKSFCEAQDQGRLRDSEKRGARNPGSTQRAGFLACLFQLRLYLLVNKPLPCVPSA